MHKVIKNINNIDYIELIILTSVMIYELTV